ncbi:MAG: glycosyltransferase [Chlorobi bacterium]|nr:glycosyltransferase [Chlorobiota bacterium]
MQYRMSVSNMMNILKKEKINTWFDLGLFIDRLKEEKPTPAVSFTGKYNEFLTELSDAGIAFITFHFTVDGVTIESEKYATIFRNKFNIKNIHYISGQFYPGSEDMIDKKTKQFEVPEIHGFDKWNLYHNFFFTKIERGSKEYNALILKFWAEVLVIAEKIGKYIEQNNIKLLYLINVCSNPGNVSLSLATVIISELLGIPVISNNHDFYWEGGNSQIDIETKGLEPGPRDFFFTNAGVGEFFSIIEVLFPWESRSWISVNINKAQNDTLIQEKGHNPANVTEISTAVDLSEYSDLSKRRKFETFKQLKSILSRYKSALVGYSAEDVRKLHLVDEKNPEPIIIGHKTRRVKNFLKENVIFLQPTRIIERKRIGVGFRLIEKLFNLNDFVAKFSESANLKLTILITGPIALGQYNYFKKLIKLYSQLLNKIPEKLRGKIFLAFMFSEMDKEEFTGKFADPIGIPELYNISSLVLLPSETEGRGLPIIEATASGVPIFCRRYYPEEVYAEVIGEHLPEKDRLKVIEYNGKEITLCQADLIFRKVFFPHKFTEEIEHNRRVVKKRYSLEALQENMNAILYSLYLQLKPNEPFMRITKSAIKEYQKIVSFENEDLHALLNTKNRHYLPGEGRLAFMHYLKSLIDPSFFRVEEQHIRSYIFYFAMKLIKYNPHIENYTQKQINGFYNAIDNIFKYSKGETTIRHDHSFSYRHRNKKYYPYQDFTKQEITGLVTLIYQKFVKPVHEKMIVSKIHFFTDWNLALSQLTSSTNLAIDDRYKLKEKLKSNLPIAFFPGKYVKYELEFFILQSVKSRLGLKIEEELVESHLIDFPGNIKPVYVFVSDIKVGQLYPKKEIIRFLESGKEPELHLLYKKEIIQLVETQQLCVGIHLPQLGEKGLKTLRKIKEQGGYLISNRRNAISMTDILDLDRFHIGRPTNSVGASVLGIPKNSGYVMYIPAGLRITLSYPTPIQTAKDFSKTLKSDLFKELCEKYGEAKVLTTLKEDAETYGSPIKLVLEKMKNSSKTKQDVEYNYVTGVYEDGYPWNGVIAKTNIAYSKKKWQFVTVSSTTKTKKVTTFVKDYYSKYNLKAKIAWNGGYILNPELVGKLGLPETYIGSPLGLLISNKTLLSAPLFNKPALIIYDDGSIDIKRVNSSKGLTIINESGNNIIFKSKGYNNYLPGNENAYYDLMSDKVEIQGNERVIIRLAGNVIKQILFTKKHERVQVVPVGLTLSFTKENFPKSFKVGQKLTIEIKGLQNIKHAVEAGPMLLDNGQTYINMAKEGWKTQNSIRTQAARLDFTDMRGPKIAVGLDKEGNLYVLTINGRIRESVGATHTDMANIMKKLGMLKAMGFDPGGSSTLVVDGKTLNISPYNKDYEENIYSLPPEPRAVANAVLGFTE